MKDRVPLYPGRVKLVPVAGQENTYDMVRADEPTQEGTPLNKATLLKDATAALFGLGADAVPDDVLALIGKYNQYWWKRRVYTVTYEISLSTASSNVYFSNGDMAPNTVYYATDIEISSDGVVSLKNPQTLACPRWEQSLNLLTAVKGKYVRNTLTSNSSVAADSETVYLISSSATFSLDSSGSPYTDSANAQKVSTHPVKTIGEWVYIMSSDRNAYPDSGISDGYEYQYLGVPFENAVTAPAIETGSYVGTGTYGASNPNRLTFDFIPKYIAIYHIGAEYDNGPIKTELMQGMYGVFNKNRVFDVTYYAGDNGNVGFISEWGTTVKFYANSLIHQPNKQGVTYKYFAIG